MSKGERTKSSIKKEQRTKKRIKFRQTSRMPLHFNLDESINEKEKESSFFEISFHEKVIECFYNRNPDLPHYKMSTSIRWKHVLFFFFFRKKKERRILGIKECQAERKQSDRKPKLKKRREDDQIFRERKKIKIQYIDIVLMTTRVTLFKLFLLQFYDDVCDRYIAIAYQLSMGN